MSLEESFQKVVDCIDVCSFSNQKQLYPVLDDFVAKHPKDLDTIMTENVCGNYNPVGETILTYLIHCFGSNPESVFYWTYIGASVDARNKNEFTPLLLAIRERDKVLALGLLERGADPNLSKSTEFKYSPLGEAIRSNINKVVDDLLEKGVEIKDEQAVLRLACEYGRCEIVRTLAFNTLSPTDRSDENSVLHFVEEEGSEKLKQLFKELWPRFYKVLPPPSPPRSPSKRSDRPSDELAPQPQKTSRT